MITSLKDNSRTVSPRSLLWVPVAVFLALYLLVILVEWRSIEEDIATRTRTALAAAGYDRVEVSLHNRGREVLLTGKAPSQEALRRLENLVQGVDGVRTIDTRLITIASPVIEKSPAVAEKLSDAAEKLPVVTERPLVDQSVPVPMSVEQEQKTTVPPPIVALEQGVPDSQCGEEGLDIFLHESTVYFDYNQQEVEEKVHGLLDDLTAMLNRCPEIRLEVSGHTDNVGSKKFNQALSEVRAEAVAGYLINAGIANDRIITVGHGSQFPMEPNTTSEEQAKNRRVEFAVKP